MPRAPRQSATLDRYSHTSVRKPNNPTVETWAQTQRTGVAAPVPVDGTEAESPPRLAAPRLDWNDRDARGPNPNMRPYTPTIRSVRATSSPACSQVSKPPSSITISMTTAARMAKGPAARTLHGNPISTLAIGITA